MTIPTRLLLAQGVDSVFDSLVDEVTDIVAALAVGGGGVEGGDLRDGEEGDGVAGVADDGLVEEAGVACYEEVAFGVERFLLDTCEGGGEVGPEGGVFEEEFGVEEGLVADGLGVDAFLKSGVYTV